MGSVKTCSRCGEAKPLDAFHRDSKKRLGVRSRCKDCLREPSRAASRRWYAQNGAAQNARVRQKRAENPDVVRQRDRERYAQRTEADREAARKYHARYRERRKEDLREYRRQWSRANPEKRREYARNASPEAKKRRQTYIRARKAEQCDWLKVYREEQGCVDCGKATGRLEYDHRPGEVKSFNVTQGLGYAWETLLAEVAKCDIRCGSCHRKRHGPERRGIPKPRKSRKT